MDWSSFIKNAKRSHFLKTGLPFLLLVVGGSFLTIDFQRVKFDERERKRGAKVLETYGIPTKLDMNEEYEKIRAANNNEWRNVRGPRPYEDNTEFLNNREVQEKRLKQYLELEKGKKVTSSEVNTVA